MSLAALRQSYEQAGQGHVFRFYDDLSETEQRTFVAQLDRLTPPERVNAIYKAATEAAQLGTHSNSSSSSHLEPPPAEHVASTVDARASSSSSTATDVWQQTALEAIRSGQVGVLLMAGGQGTRLGSSAPKGCYDIGLPSHKSLFQIQAERIRRLQRVAESDEGIPWYIMTSGPTRQATEDMFKQHDFFGMNSDDVIFFEQGVLPCLSNDGKILLDTKGSVAVAPDGNGGIYAALRSPTSSLAGASPLQDIERRGIKYLHAYCVDNCLVRVADPIFVGYCITSGAECGVKVVRKTDPAESVGVVALRDGKYSVVEYSEIPRELSEQRDPSSGELTYRAANIANHFYTLDFLKRVDSFENEMAYHVASKKIAHVNVDADSGSPALGERVKPTKPNGIKLELFVFDVFPFVRQGKMAVLEVDRATDFSPLKNAPGTGADDPETSRRDLLREQKKWLLEAGAQFANDDVEIEVSPLVSYAGEGLESVKGKTFNKSGIINSLQDVERLS